VASGRHRLRAATHLDVSYEQIETAAELLARALHDVMNGTTSAKADATTR